jgi:hypothetical protein
MQDYLVISTDTTTSLAESHTQITSKCTKVYSTISSPFAVTRPIRVVTSRPEGMGRPRLEDRREAEKDCCAITTFANRKCWARTHYSAQISVHLTCLQLTARAQFSTTACRMS